MIVHDTGFSLTPLQNNIAGRNTAAPAAASQKGGFAETLREADPQKTDRIELSSRASASGASLSAVHSGIREEIDADADPSRLASLKNSIGNGTYGFDPTEMARILLDYAG